MIDFDRNWEKPDPPEQREEILAEKRCARCGGTKESPRMTSDDSYSMFECPWPFHWKDN